MLFCEAILRKIQGRLARLAECISNLQLGRCARCAVASLARSWLFAVWSEAVLEDTHRRGTKMSVAVQQPVAEDASLGNAKPLEVLPPSSEPARALNKHSCACVFL